MNTEVSIVNLPLDAIRADANIRKQFSAEELQGLAQSMIACGQLQPVRVRQSGDRYLLIDGERRLRAARQVGLPTLAAIVDRDDSTVEGPKLRALVSNAQRTDLTPLELAEAVRELMSDSGWKASEVGSKIGFSNAKLSRLLALLKLPEPIREQIRAGTIPASCGAELARIEDAGEQTALAEKIAAGQLTRDGLSAVKKRRTTSRPTNSDNAIARATASLGNGRSVTLAGSGLTSLDAMIAWLEELLGRARKVRPKGIGLKTFLKMLHEESKAL